MRLQFTKMVQFSLLLKAGDRVREFNFRKLRIPHEDLFSVNVCDERGNRILFNLEKQETEWKIVPGGKLPRWVVQNEERLREAVEEELRSW
jgi:hypothetical protein